MNPAARLYMIRNRMEQDKKYSAHQLYAIYTGIMNDQENMQRYKTYAYSTIRDQLRDEYKKNTWLDHHEGLYFKKSPPCAFSRWHKVIVELWGKYVSST